MKFWEVITITVAIVRRKFHAYRIVSDSIIAFVYVCDRGYCNLNMENNLRRRRIAIKCCLEFGKSAAETFQMLNNAYGESVTSSVFRSDMGRFPSGNGPFDDERKSGRPQARRKHRLRHSCFERTSNHWLQVSGRVNWNSKNHYHSTNNQKQFWGKGYFARVLFWTC